MRVAQIAPLYESVPPQKYGGTERVIAHLTEALVGLGHEVTLFASGDSQTSADLIPMVEKSLRIHAGYEHSHLPHLVMMEEIRKREHEFDVIHFHTDCMQFPLQRTLSTPSLTTLHGRLDIPQYVSVYRAYGDLPFISISDSQRAPLSWINWTATIKHGLPKTLYRPQVGPGKYAAFLGRISPEKRPDRAIEIARRAGVPLKIAAKIDPNDRDYYQKVIRPLIEDNPDIEFVGEIGDIEKNRFLGNAAVLLFPIDWPEPFGLVMIEAMACGTPVIAFRNGSAPEVVDEGVTGFLVDSVDEAVEKMSAIPTVDRALCRLRFEHKFSMDAVVQSYLAVYEDLIEKNNRFKRMRGSATWTTSSESMANLI